MDGALLLVWVEKDAYEVCVFDVDGVDESVRTASVFDDCRCSSCCLMLFAGRFPLCDPEASSGWLRIGWCSLWPARSSSRLAALIFVADLTAIPDGDGDSGMEWSS